MFRGQDPATGEQRCHPLLRADPRSKLPAGPLLITALRGNRIRWHEVAKWLPEKQAKHTRQVADLALWEPEVVCSIRTSATGLSRHRRLVRQDTGDGASLVKFGHVQGTPGPHRPVR
jgi:hypothetical protein